MSGRRIKDPPQSGAKADKEAGQSDLAFILALRELVSVELEANAAPPARSQATAGAKRR